LIHIPARRFPPPWSVDELETCFVVKDSADFDEEPAGDRWSKMLGKDEARRIAANVANLPELFWKALSTRRAGIGPQAVVFLF
jgi:hypothetical protein